MAVRNDGRSQVSAIVTEANEERQLRLGLGQVLRYRHLLEQSGRRARAVLAIEREPSDSSWLELCESLKVVLVWPGSFERIADVTPAMPGGSSVL